MRPVYFILYIVLFACLAGCTKPSNEEEEKKWANVVFWSSTDLGIVNVLCNGDTKQITGYSTSGTAPACGGGYFATFLLTVGNHSYTAVSTTTGMTWSGDILVTGDTECINEELIKTGGSGGPSTGGKGGLQVLIDIHRGATTNNKKLLSTNISVTVDGIKIGTITSPYISTYVLPYSSPGSCAGNSNNSTTVYYTGDAGKQVYVNWKGTFLWELTNGTQKSVAVDYTERINIVKDHCQYHY